jgi:ribonucleoside-diphosphate reductase beta chain
MSLLDSDPIYKPFRYPWAYDAWLTQQRIHWLPEEVPMADDVKDWRNRLTPAERNLLTQIFRFFTQADVEVNNCYMQHYSRVFKPTEVKMMLAAFSNMETVHIAAYSHLLDTIGMPESEYQAFLKYKAMKDKYDYMQKWGVETPADIARTLAVFGAFTEGLQLFASFAILYAMNRCIPIRRSACFIPSSTRTGCCGTTNYSATLSSPARPSSTMRTPSSTSPSRWAASRG